jgi:hypothetical protein
MAEFTRVLLSALDPDQGQPLLVTQTASAGNTVHTTGVSATIFDEITLFVSNNDPTPSVDHTLYVQFGGTATRNLIGPISVPFNSGRQLVISGEPLAGTGAAGAVVRVYADVANVLTVGGWVSRYTP